jgi:hypothetical protein
LAYRLCADDAATTADVDELLARVDGYVRAPADNPNARRWQVSLHYVAAKMHLWCGRREEARVEFEHCADLDVLPYSPVLGTKTIDALFQIGMIATSDGDFDGARAAWTRAITMTERLLQGDWKEWMGAPGQPLTFALPEATDVLDIAAECARGLLALPEWSRRSGLSWEIATASKRATRAMLERDLQSLRELDVQRVATLSSVVEREAEMVRKAREFAETESRLTQESAEAERKLADETAEVTRLREELSMLRGSLSWRMTGPVRWALRGFKK